MALINALLVRYAKGYTFVEDASSIATHGRREGYVTLGMAQSGHEATTIAVALLATKAQPADAVLAEVEPTGNTDKPYWAFNVGDYVILPTAAGPGSLYRTRAITVDEDEMGDVAFHPEFGTLADEFEIRLERWLKRLSNGALGGTIESATPASSASGIESSRTRPKELPPFSIGGTVATGQTTPIYWPPESVRVHGCWVGALVAPSGNLTMDFYRYPALTVVATVTLPSGTVSAFVDVDFVLAGPHVEGLIGLVTNGASAQFVTVVFRTT